MHHNDIGADGASGLEWAQTVQMIDVKLQGRQLHTVAMSRYCK